MATKVTFFPVGNGDMTLIKLNDRAGTTILIDCKILETAEDTDEVDRNVARDLRQRLNRDADGRPYVDAFLLSHPDQDHCLGFSRHFHLGPLEDYADDKKEDWQKRIVIRELWSSPIVFRRASRTHVLCDDAKAFNCEAKRRVGANRESFFDVDEGDRILILGEDEGGKTDDLDPIVVKVDESILAVNGIPVDGFSARLIAPLPGADERMEEDLSKNNSSVILNIELPSDVRGTTSRFLTGGDSEVQIWELVWERHKADPSALEYDLLQAPHHCSWHSLSHDSWSELHEHAEISADARAALSQIRHGGGIVASSCPIKDDDNDPPCWGAKCEYESIVETAGGTFHCTGEHPDQQNPAPLEFEVSTIGFDLLQPESDDRRSVFRSAPAVITSGLMKTWDSERPSVRKEGGGRYA